MNDNNSKTSTGANTKQLYKTQLNSACSIKSPAGAPALKHPETINSDQKINSNAATTISWALDVLRVAKNLLNATGKDKMKLKKQNKQWWKMLQALQDPQSHWTTHHGQLPYWTFTKVNIKPKWGQMWPKNLAATHPAGELLCQYAMEGCTVNSGRNWMVDEMQAATNKGSHSSAMDPAAIKQAKEEFDKKIKRWQARVVVWDDIKKKPPEKLKISPFAMIPLSSTFLSQSLWRTRTTW